jgi:nucleoside-diphosphate-sugar epimerase
MRLLVVGGSGFIGRHVVERGRERGWNVSSVSLNGRKDIGRAEGAIGVNIADPVALRESLRDTQFDYVVNCAGYVDHKPFSQAGRTVIDAHFGGVMNLAQTIDRASLRAFVNIGSSDEYGSAPAPQVESARERAISPYSLAKVAATHFLQMLHRTEQFPSTTLRLFLTYGPGQGSQRFLPQIVSGCLDGRPFPVSSGTQLRDFCFIDDVVDAVFAALVQPAARGEVINVASGRPVSIRAVIDAVRSIVGRGEPQYGAIAHREGENMELYADIAKAQSLLGWTPKIELEVGIARTIAAVAPRS